MRLLKHEMEEEIRKTGIDIIGDVPWGTHFCQFYQTREDLIDVLVPYFKAGLVNNEFCMWVTSEPLSAKEAKKAMRKAVPNFDRDVRRRQMEIVSYTEWYLKDGAFNLQRILNGWIDKLNQALAKGYNGIRVTGNTTWLEKRDWRSFIDYEKKVNRVIGKYRMIAICTYSLGKCGASEVIDVVRNHQFAIVKRRDVWEPIKSSELKRAKETLKRSEMRLKDMFAACARATAKNGTKKTNIGYKASLKLHRQQHDMLKAYTLLNHLRDNPKNLMKLHKELKKHKGFRAFHSMYRHLQVCTNLKLVELKKVDKKWGLPTKTYGLTEKGREFLEIFDLKGTIDLKEILDLEGILDLEEVST